MTAFKILVVLAVLAWVGCDRMPTMDPKGLEPGSALVFLDNPALKILGPMEGPWSFNEAVSPTNVKLLKDGVAQEFVILGLHPDEYPDPDATAKGATDMEPEELRRLEEIRDYKRRALTELLKNEPLWVVRVSDDKTPLAHLFIAQDAAAKNQPGQKGWLVSAKALREGIASMVLDGGDYDMRETMLDCQFAAIAESLHVEKGRADSLNIWSRFDLRLPPAEWDARIDAMEQKLGLKTKK